MRCPVAEQCHPHRTPPNSFAAFLLPSFNVQEEPQPEPQEDEEEDGEGPEEPEEDEEAGPVLRAASRPPTVHHGQVRLTMATLKQLGLVPPVPPGHQGGLRPPQGAAPGRECR